MKSLSKKKINILSRQSPSLCTSQAQSHRKTCRHPRIHSKEAWGRGRGCGRNSPMLKLMALQLPRHRARELQTAPQRPQHRVPRQRLVCAVLQVRLHLVRGARLHLAAPVRIGAAHEDQEAAPDVGGAAGAAGGGVDFGALVAAHLVLGEGGARLTTLGASGVGCGVGCGRDGPPGVGWMESLKTG